MMIKRAILFVTFGGIRPEVREPIEDWFISEGADRWPDRWIEMVSGVETLKESLQDLGGNGFGEVVVQPLLINHGNEYEKIRNAVNGFVSEDTAPMKIRLGKPRLTEPVGPATKPSGCLTANSATSPGIPPSWER